MSERGYEEGYDIRKLVRVSYQRAFEHELKIKTQQLVVFQGFTGMVPNFCNFWRGGRKILFC